MGIIAFCNLKVPMSSVVLLTPAEYRLGVLKSVAPSDLVTADKAQCLRIQASLGLGPEWGTLTLPSEWLPRGSGQNNRVVKFAARVADADASESARDFAVLQMTRLALLYFLVPMPVGRGHALAAPTTWKDNLRILGLMVQEGLRRGGGPESGVLSCLTCEELAHINKGNGINAWLAKLAYMKHQYGWRDAPKPDTAIRLEKARKGTLAPVNNPAKGPGYLALPDDFVAQAGWRVSWLIENVGPALLKCAKAMIEVCEANPLRGRNAHTCKARRVTALRRLLAKWDWRTVAGAPLTSLAFPLYLVGRGGAQSDEPFDWPPKAPGRVLDLLKFLQISHLFVFLLSTGGRISEALSLNRGCIVDTTEGQARVEGRTFKLVFDDNGQIRDWPLPELGLKAVQQQENLAHVLDKLGRLYTLEPPALVKKSSTGEVAALWVRIGAKGEPMKGDHSTQFPQLVRALGLEQVLGLQPLHSHRFRKSIARLIALAIAAGAPKILMDLFGHQSIEMTLHYILTDPAIKSEMEEIAKAQVVMLAEAAIKEAETNGGPAAARIRDAVAVEKARLGSQFGDSELHALAQTFTFSGTVWRLVRPGVLCTKGAQQSGPCNSRVGHPEPSRCRGNCDHRLEQAAFRDDVDRLLAEAVACLDRAVADDDEITAELWRGQILANLPRFDDLAAKWSANTTVSKLLALTPKS